MPTTTAPALQIRPAIAGDIERIIALMPRLAAFEVPAHREPDSLWLGDADMLRDWAAGRRDDLVVHVAVDASDQVLGVAAASDREDLLTHAPSAHLEVLALDARAEGQGAGRRLIEVIESAMRERGATGMSLHVFSNNARARALYARAGFDEEIVRCYKPFDADT